MEARTSPGRGAGAADAVPASDMAAWAPTRRPRRSRRGSQPAPPNTPTSAATIRAPAAAARSSSIAMDSWSDDLLPLPLAGGEPNEGTRRTLIRPGIGLLPLRLRERAGVRARETGLRRMRCVACPHPPFEHLAPRPGLRASAQAFMVARACGSQALLFLPARGRRKAARRRMTEPPPSRIVEVVAGVIRDTRGRVLLARRTEGRDLAGLWEFPGASASPMSHPRPRWSANCARNSASRSRSARR